MSRLRTEPIQGQVSQALDRGDVVLRAVWTQAMWDKLVAAARSNKILEPTDYPGAQRDLRAAWRWCRPGSRALVVGAVSPWVEAMLHVDGYRTHTLDINLPIDEANCTTSLTYDAINTKQLKFDLVVAFSTVEHIGLGRYGDEIDPAGDRKWMSWARNLLNTDGVLLLGVPLAPKGRVEQDLHRIYGQSMYRELIQGWEVAAAFWRGERTIRPVWRRPDATGLHAWQYQPVVALRPAAKQQRLRKVKR